jgi:hypothetical protein
MKNTLLITAFTLLSAFEMTQAQNVNIPDANFKAYLLGNLTINTNNDNEIQLSEAGSFNGVIVCNNLNIADLTGIETFTALFSLECKSNQITSLNISTINNLNSLDISSNAIASVNLSNNTNLEHLYCNNNPLTSLNVSPIFNLKSFHCNNNQLTNLNVSTNNFLSALECNSNQLSSLNVKNSNNTGMYLSALGNPSLYCITVDNADYSKLNWTNVDPTATFSEDCSLIAGISRSEAPHNSKVFYPNPTTGAIYLSAPFNFTLTDLTGKIILQKQNSEFIDITALHSGMYFIFISNDMGQYITKAKVTKE